METEATTRMSNEGARFGELDFTNKYDAEDHEWLIFKYTGKLPETEDELSMVADTVHRFFWDSPLPKNFELGYIDDMVSSSSGYIDVIVPASSGFITEFLDYKELFEWPTFDFDTLKGKNDVPIEDSVFRTLIKSEFYEVLWHNSDRRDSTEPESTREQLYHCVVDKISNEVFDVINVKVQEDAKNGIAPRYTVDGVLDKLVSIIDPIIPTAERECMKGHQPEETIDSLLKDNPNFFNPIISTLTKDTDLKLTSPTRKEQVTEVDRNTYFKVKRAYLAEDIENKIDSYNDAHEMKVMFSESQKSNMVDFFMDYESDYVSYNDQWERIIDIAVDEAVSGDTGYHVFSKKEPKDSLNDRITQMNVAKEHEEINSASPSHGSGHEDRE